MGKRLPTGTSNELPNNLTDFRHYPHSREFAPDASDLFDFPMYRAEGSLHSGALGLYGVGNARLKRCLAARGLIRMFRWFSRPDPKSSAPH